MPLFVPLKKYNDTVRTNSKKLKLNDAQTGAEASGNVGLDLGRGSSNPYEVYFDPNTDKLMAGIDPDILEVSRSDHYHFFIKDSNNVNNNIYVQKLATDPNTGYPVLKWSTDQLTWYPFA